MVLGARSGGGLDVWEFGMEVFVWENLSSFTSSLCTLHLYPFSEGLVETSDRQSGCCVWLCWIPSLAPLTLAPPQSGCPPVVDRHLVLFYIPLLPSLRSMSLLAPLPFPLPLSLHFIFPLSLPPSHHRHLSFPLQLSLPLSLSHFLCHSSYVTPGQLGSPTVYPEPVGSVRLWFRLYPSLARDI